MRIRDWSSDVCSSDLLGDLETPELMLQDDGHLARIAFAQNLRNLAVRMSGAEGDVEMVVARQAVSRHMDQGPPHHAAQRIFDHAIVAQAALSLFLGHVTSRPASCCRSEERRLGKEWVSPFK